MQKNLFYFSAIFLLIISCDTKTRAQYSGNGAVSCFGETCVAVGDYRTKNISVNLNLFRFAPLIALSQDSGRTFNAKIVNMPRLPQNADTSDHQDAGLNAITCSSKKCLTVGHYKRMAVDSMAYPRAPLLMFSEDGGKTFQVDETINSALPSNSDLSDTEYVSLNAITCSMQSCLIVGSYKTKDGDDNSAVPLILMSQNQAKTFTPVTPTAFPSNMDTTSSEQTYLSGLSCERNECVAVGQYKKIGGTPFTNSNAPLVLLSHDGGRSFNEIATVHLPTDAGTDFAVLSSVTCGQQKCVAVGSYIQKGNTSQIPLALESSDGGKTFYSSSAIALPTNADSAPDNVFTLFSGITCTENNCIAVGNYQKQKINNKISFAPLTVLSDNNGQTFRTTVTPVLPNNAATQENELAVLIGVTCLQKNCVTVGFYNLVNSLFTIAPLTIFSDDSGQSFSKAHSCELPDDAETAPDQQIACFGICAFA